LGFSDLTNLGESTAAPCCQQQSAKLRPALVDAGRSLPVENIHQFPGILIEVNLQLPLLIDHELCGRIQDTRALVFVLVIQVDFTGRQVEGLRLGIGPNFAEAKLPIGNKADFSSGRSLNQTDETAVVAEGAGEWIER
jgi:hypothetical protein